MTKIEFTDEHLNIINKALEVYSRLRSGQVKIAMDEAYYDYRLTWEESESIENYVRKIIFPSPPYIEYDGHGGYFDQYGNSYNESGEILEITYEQKCRNKRPQDMGRHTYFGVGSKEMSDNGGTLAYEIQSTLRQYLALKKNDGYYENTTDFRDPLHLTSVPLPIIEGFNKEKKFVIKGKSIVKKIQDAEDKQDWQIFWNIINKHIREKYSINHWDKARAEKEGIGYAIFVEGATKKKNDN
jgi:hypothetical protein